MPKPSTLEVCRTHLFAPKDELEAKYDAMTVARVLRLRDMYTWRLSYPSEPDRKLIDELTGRYGISQSAAYYDLDIIKKLIPALSAATKDYYRWQANEMALEAFRTAKKHKDAKAMASAAKLIADINKVWESDGPETPYEDIVPQPFTATSDPTVLGIKPIPNIQVKIKEMIDKYRAETLDIEDVEAEEIDLEEEDLYSDREDDERETDIL